MKAEVHQPFELNPNTILKKTTMTDRCAYNGGRRTLFRSVLRGTLKCPSPIHL